jgi:hypothetical protein
MLHYQNYDGSGVCPQFSLRNHPEIGQGEVRGEEVCGTEFRWPQVRETFYDRYHYATRRGIRDVQDVQFHSGHVYTL